ncbi:MAG: C45 family peptidase [Lachnospiraceae bacterium]|nr:C45 family peptidase [Lachnospiraceae bacterium]
MMYINWEKHLDFDSNIVSPNMREIIFVKGSSYEMGKQYGAEVGDMIKRNFCVVAGDALRNHTKEKIVSKLEVIVEEIRKKTPDIIDWYKGIADGSGLSFGEVVLINMQLWLTDPYLMCSTIAATKSATCSQETIVGVNGDITYNMSGYGVILVAYPESGNAFITLPQLAGQLGANFVMNDKGLIITFDGGESELPEDTSFGYADFISAAVHTVSKCDEVNEAEKFLKDLCVAGGWIFLLADANKKLEILEHTSDRDYVRLPGENGEVDFINAANHFIHKEMRKSSLSYEENKESYMRYDAETQLLKDNIGDLSLEKMMDILACHNTYENGVWKENVWGVVEGNYTPEMRAPDFRTGTRCFGIAEECTAYILQGTADTHCSYMPESTGKYCKIQLLPTPRDTVYMMEENAIYETWLAAKRLSESTEQLQMNVPKLDDAKRHIAVGKNYLAKANLYSEFDDEEARKHYGYAASEFEYAYIKALLV